MRGVAHLPDAFELGAGNSNPGPSNPPDNRPDSEESWHAFEALHKDAGVPDVTPDVFPHPEMTQSNLLGCSLGIPFTAAAGSTENHAVDPWLEYHQGV